MPDATLVTAAGPLQVEATAAVPPAPLVPPRSTPGAAALKSTQRVDLSVLEIAAAAQEAPPPALPKPALAPPVLAPVSAAQSASAQPSLAQPSSAQPSLAQPALAKPLPTPHVVSDTVVPALTRSLDNVLSEGWDLCAGRRGLLALGTGILLCASVALCATVVGVAALMPLWGGLVVVGLRAGSGRRIELDDFFAGVRAFVPLALLGLMMGVLFALGTAALVVPGIYLAVAGVYAPFLVLDRERGPWQAFVESQRTVHESIVPHVGLVVMLGLVNLAGAAPLGLGLLVTLPFTFVALGVAYGRFVGYAGGVDRSTG